MPEKGARHLILISRSGGDEQAREALNKLQADGVNVEVCRCDVGDAREMDQTLAPVLQRMPPVRGVVYGAMVLRVSFPLHVPVGIVLIIASGHAIRKDDH